MGDIVELAELRSACGVLIDWSDNPPSVIDADWNRLQGAVEVLQKYRKIGGELGSAIQEVVTPSDDPEGVRLDGALATLRRMMHLPLRNLPLAPPSTSVL